jgi:hypothetical protein
MNVFSPSVVSEDKDTEGAEDEVEEGDAEEG